MTKQKELEQLIYIISRLPGLGRRSATRIVLHLLSDPERKLANLTMALTIAGKSITHCKICGNLGNGEKCSICLDKSRDDSLVAIVENVSDLWAIERSNNFVGKYHVLGTNLSTISVNSPEILKLEHLKQRIIQGNIKEIIIALSSTLDGQTTAYYITEYFKNLKVKFSKLASGVPIGGDLEYLDEGTVSAALDLRHPFE